MYHLYTYYINRSCRLGQEQVSLPQIHFNILVFLSAFQLVGFTFLVSSTLPVSGDPSVESRLLFGVLTSFFTMAYTFACDLNQPFEGAYQVRRSAISAYLLQIYSRISKTCDVDFCIIEGDNDPFSP